MPPAAKTAFLQDRLLHLTVSDRTHQTILAQIGADPEQQQASRRQVAIKERRRDPSPIKARGWRDRNPTSLDSESALAAALLFGSPEFQRR